MSMRGAAYDTAEWNASDTCPPTSARNTRSFPTPSALRHSITVCAIVTMQSVAASSVPDTRPYRRFTSGALEPSGPRFTPLTRMRSPPRVDSADACGSDTAVIIGGSYAVRAGFSDTSKPAAKPVECCTVTPTRHSSPALTPSAVSHTSTSLSAPDGRAQFVAVYLFASVVGPYVTDYVVPSD